MNKISETFIPFDLMHPNLNPDSDPFDPRGWDNFNENGESFDDEAPTAKLDFAEIQNQINQTIRDIDEDADLPSIWSTISLGGPVEPSLPTEEWNGLLLVGKAPGDAELAHNAPFTGKSGRLLDRILAHHGINRRACMITNAFRMQPLWSVDAEGRKNPNDITHFFTHDPTIANANLPRLNDRYVLSGPDQHIRDLWRLARRYKPKLIVAMGGIASWAITGDGSLKGRVGEMISHDCCGAPALITYHPAYALHKKDESMAALIAEHFGMAKTYLDSLPEDNPDAT